MTSETTKSFLSSVASTMLAYKRYPTREDYINVGRSVIQQYDFMAQPTGAPYVSMFLLLKIMLYNFFSLGGIIQLLMNHFKEFRHPSTICGSSSSATPVTTSKTSPKRKSPGITQTPRRPPLFSPGEDAVSLERHHNLLKAEFKRKKRNDTVVSDLMKRSFPLRRQTILEKPMNLDSMFERLQDMDQVYTLYELLNF